MSCFASSRGVHHPSLLASVEQREVVRLLDTHVQGREKTYKELWALFMLGEWARRWLG